METTDVLLTALIAGFGGLWYYFRQSNEKRTDDLQKSHEKTIELLKESHTSQISDRDKQLSEEKQRVAELEAKLDRAQDILGKNTEALAENAKSQQDVVAMLSDLFGETASQRSSTHPR